MVKTTNCYYFQIKVPSYSFCPGHSFGGATTLYSLAKDPRFKLGVVLDGWLFPLRDEDVAQQINHPVMFINTGNMIDGFTH